MAGKWQDAGEHHTDPLWPVQHFLLCSKFLGSELRLHRWPNTGKKMEVKKKVSLWPTYCFSPCVSNIAKYLAKDKLDTILAWAQTRVSVLGPCKCYLFLGIFTSINDKLIIKKHSTDITNEA